MANATGSDGRWLAADLDERSDRASRYLIRIGRVTSGWVTNRATVRVWGSGSEKVQM